MPDRSRILVVDDSTTARRKLSLAVSVLGHEVTEVSGGQQALQILTEQDFDLVLLDIVMPDIDGYEVLKRMKLGEQPSEIPVLVVSGLENEPGAVIEAIRLGAIDFLPKAFEPVLLEARVSAALRRKRNRDKELAEITDINRLVGAAKLLEKSLVDSEHLDIADLAERPDEFGTFAGAFSRLAESLYLRERGKRRRLAQRGGLFLLIASGTLFGLSAPLSRIASSDTSHAVGLALWVNVMTAAVCLAVTAWRGRWPEPSAKVIKFVVMWGVIGAAMTEIVLFAAARYVPASTLSVVIALESFFVFAMSAMLGHERATPRRLLGLVFGLAGILVVVQPWGGEAAGGGDVWLLVAVGLAFIYAAEDLLLAISMPSDLDLFAAVGLAALVASVLLFPLVWMLDEFVSPIGLQTSTIIAVLGITFGAMLATVMIARLIASAGAVFASQVSYVITFAGVLWAIVLLGERLSPTLWGALGLLFIGLLLVEPKRESDSVLDVGVYGEGK